MQIFERSLEEVVAAVVVPRAVSSPSPSGFGPFGTPFGGEEGWYCLPLPTPPPDRIENDVKIEKKQQQNAFYDHRQFSFKAQTNKQTDWIWIIW